MAFLPCIAQVQPVRQIVMKPQLIRHEFVVDEFNCGGLGPRPVDLRSRLPAWSRQSAPAAIMAVAMNASASSFMPIIKRRAE